ncbi:hypothetical protein JCM19037_3465 [Geomicrobium sp. JCM 19037]|uniref:hypothetical protein n=1 Tax=unclassified Geomicrobium TaxID=2628951 RepID=UPI00045F4852|nr:hypothetical protein [Geomicrobium sp. JCM 19037]GAK05004.1 hypothetical protein JCM19037_3465 [Geomicrobium sp. JCM 19037]
MKKFALSISLASVFVLAGCLEIGEESLDSDVTEEEVEEEAPGDVDVENEEEDEETEEPAEPEGVPEVGDTVTNENGEHTLVSLNEDIEALESSPISLEIEKVNGVSAMLEGMAADMVDDPDVEYIQVDMVVENTSDDDVTFYASQATLITDTGEQSEADMLLSDHIDGDYFGNVTKSGTSIFVLNNSMAEEMTSVQIRFSAPYNTESWDDLGEDIRVDIDL